MNIKENQTGDCFFFYLLLSLLLTGLRVGREDGMGETETGKGRGNGEVEKYSSGVE